MLNATATLDTPFTAELDDPTSPEFQQEAKKFCSAVEATLEDSDFSVNCLVTAFR